MERKLTEFELETCAICFSRVGKRWVAHAYINSREVADSEVEKTSYAAVRQILTSPCKIRVR